MRFITLIIAITLFPLTINAKNKKELSFKEIETGFLQIPEDTQIAVYWYWISDNLSEEGIIRDLEAMKKVGINRAFIGNIGLDDVKYGKVKLFSEEWWKILHTALKKASELNIEIGIFNSPGWSQSMDKTERKHALCGLFPTKSERSAKLADQPSFRCRRCRGYTCPRFPSTGRKRLPQKMDHTKTGRERREPRHQSTG